MVLRVKSGGQPKINWVPVMMQTNKVSTSEIFNLFCKLWVAFKMFNVLRCENQDTFS